MDSAVAFGKEEGGVAEAEYPESEGGGSMTANKREKLEKELQRLEEMQRYEREYEVRCV